MIVVDTSALVAMTFAEETAPALRTRLLLERDRKVSVVNVVEFGAVYAGRWRGDPDLAADRVWTTLQAMGLDAVGVDDAQARLALGARIRFGKGFGAKAKLNFGDSFAYALAKSLNAPLLFVGDDFTQTDIAPALAANP